MSNVKDRNITVLLRANAKKPGGVEFTMPGANLVFKNEQHDGFRVFFNIEDPDRTKYRFPDDLREALWVEEIPPNGPDKCPLDYSFWSEFDAKQVLNDNKTLRVRNKNGCEARFGFTLRFTKEPAGGGPYVPYDPIGDNRNGPTSSAFSIAATAIGFVAVAAVALFAFSKIYR